MGQSSSKQNVTLTSNKKLEEQTSNGKNDHHDNPQGKDTLESNNTAPSQQNGHKNSDPHSQKVNATLENGNKQTEKESGDSPTSEKGAVLKKRTSFYETVDASEILPYLMIGQFQFSKLNSYQQCLQQSSLNFNPSIGITFSMKYLHTIIIIMISFMIR